MQKFSAKFSVCCVYSENIGLNSSSVRVKHVQLTRLCLLYCVLYIALYCCFWQKRAAAAAVVSAYC